MRKIYFVIYFWALTDLDKGKKSNPNAFCSKYGWKSRKFLSKKNNSICTTSTCKVMLWPWGKPKSLLNLHTWKAIYFWSFRSHFTDIVYDKLNYISIDSSLLLRLFLLFSYVLGARIKFNVFQCTLIFAEVGTKCLHFPKIL